MRFIDTDISASVLITDEYCFYEPYTNFNNPERMNKLLSTLELKLNKQSKFYQNALLHFDLLWENGIEFDKLVSDEKYYSYKAIQEFNAHQGVLTQYYVGVHAAILCNENKPFSKKRFLLLRRSEKNDFKPFYWDMPGGTMESGETLFDTLKREVHEETSLIVPDTSGDIIWSYTNIEELPIRQTVQLIVEIPKCEGEIVLNELEHDTYEYLTAEEALRLPLMDYVRSYFVNEVKSKGEG